MAAVPSVPACPGRVCIASKNCPAISTGKDERIENTEVIVPRLQQLVIVRGENLHFDGLTFSHNEWVPGREARKGAAQAAWRAPGALSFRGAHHCSVGNCVVTHVGSYGIEVSEGSSDVEIAGNKIAELAAGGVKVWHGSRRVTITDNEIADGGHRWRQAVGVLIGKCSGNKVLHNHIHDFDYTGVSVGWTWGYAESDAYGNIIEHNHIHHIGRGALSDLGGIYTLGVSPGTRLRFNLIHDIESRGYGGWGIYTDEGSSDILIENNIVYRTKTQSFHQHYGRNNIVRNNIFAFSGEGGLAVTRPEPHPAFRFERNIILTNGTGKCVGGRWQDAGAVVDRNLYFRIGRGKLEFEGKSFGAWQKRGFDRHSLIADPRFVAPERGDFRLRARSPARKLGFIPVELMVGPRKTASSCAQ